jgi:acetolactate synthase-1/2/3 large subunit
VLQALAGMAGAPQARQDWFDALRARERARDEDIAGRAAQPVTPLNPIALCQAVDAHLGDTSIVVADGGDFVATASYILRPRAPLSWLDPGVFGTLGVGAGFILGAHAARPGAEIWAIFGDGALGFSLAEFDTLVRNRVPVVAVVGNDGKWAQIARDQVAVLGDDVATNLGRAAYHRVVEGFGARGLLLDDPSRIADTLGEARRIANTGVPVLVNAMIGDTDFRKGSISL